MRRKRIVLLEGTKVRLRPLEPDDMKAVFLGGEFRDVYVYSILREEWEKTKG